MAATRPHLNIAASRARTAVQTLPVAVLATRKAVSPRGPLRRKPQSANQHLDRHRNLLLFSEVKVSLSNLCGVRLCWHLQHATAPSNSCKVQACLTMYNDGIRSNSVMPSIASPRRECKSEWNLGLIRYHRFGSIHFNSTS